jgi:hypothetical protein
LLRTIAPVLGVLLMAVVLADVFLTVLYARIGTGIIGDRLARLVWQLFRAVASPLGRRRDAVLSFAGPAIVLVVVSVWVFMLTVGSALIIYPRLGSSIVATSGRTPTDFTTAMYAGGNSITLVGAGNFSPQTPGFRLFYIFNSLVGLSMISLTLTYIMQIYTALQGRNVLALSVHYATECTGDAAELIASLGPRGDFGNAYIHLVQMASQMTALKESHHFYPVLVYFRFRDSHYALSRLALVLLDTVALMKTALDDQRHALLKDSPAMGEMRTATMALITSVERTFVPGGEEAADRPPDAQAVERWRRRYFDARRRLRRAGIQTTADESAGAEAYVAARSDWDRYVVTFAEFGALDMDVVDIAGSRGRAEGKGQEFRPRLRPAG